MALPRLVHHRGPIVVAACAGALAACRPAPSTTVPTVVVHEPDAPTARPASTPASPPPEDDPAARCREWLARFGPRALEAELEPCVEALTTAREKADCAARGLEDAYLRCFDGCMRSVGITEEEYDPSDASSSPVENCEGGCFQTDCGT